MSKHRDPRQIAREILKCMVDGTYSEDMDQMREDAEELALAVLAKKSARKPAKKSARKPAKRIARK